jgi:hypothetical protein
MRSRWFLWIVAVLIGSALALSPVVSLPLLAQEKGATGTTGEKGAKGEKGGTKGTKGEKGSKGATGATGAKGEEKKM